MEHKPGKPIPLSFLTKTASSRIEDLYHQRQTPGTISTGLAALDTLTTGIHDGDLVAVVADNPDLATAFLLSLVHAVSVEDQIPSLFLSARHDETCITTRILSIESGVGEARLRTGMLQMDHLAACSAAAGVLHTAPLHVTSANAISMESTIASLAEQTERIIFIDGLPACHHPDEDHLQRLRELASQDGRAVVFSTATSPDQHHHRKIDWYRDVVLHVRQPTDPESHVEVEIQKNRHGGLGRVLLHYVPHCSAMEDIDAARITMFDICTSLRTVNARHGETLRRLGEETR